MFRLSQTFWYFLNYNKFMHVSKSNNWHYPKTAYQRQLNMTTSVLKSPPHHNWDLVSCEVCKLRLGGHKCPHLSDVKFVAEQMTSSVFWTMTGIFRQPEDLRIFCRSLRVSCRTFGGHMSIFVTTTNTGTFRARARPKCSLVMPITPAFAPTYRFILEQFWETG